MPAYPVERHMRYRAIRSPTFGPDGESIFFRYDITGNYQIWEVKKPREWPRQWTVTGRDVKFGAWSPTGHKLAFGMDSAGDEHVQLYYLDREYEQFTRLTDDPDTIHKWGGWNRDGTQFAYAANRRHNSLYDVYIQGINESYDQAERVYEHDRASQIIPAGWGPENKHLLLYEMHTNYNMDLHLLDVTTKEHWRLTSGPKQETRYRGVMWGPDGRSLYLITDYDHNWLYVARLDVETGELEPVVQADMNIRKMVFHPRERRLAYVTYGNGFSEIMVGDLTAPTEISDVSVLDLPIGTAESLTMSQDGTRLATVYYTPNTKPDIYVADIEDGTSVQWTDINTPVPEEVYVSPDAVTYESFDGLEIPSLYTTPIETEEKQLPAIIHLHGGPQESNWPTFDPLRQFYAERGYVWFEPNFRGSSGFGKEFMTLDDVEKRPDAIKDIKAAAEWLAEQENIDEDRIALHGASYGGFLVLRAMTNWPNLFAAGIAMSAIVNFETFLENTGAWRKENREAEYGSLSDHRELLRELSPIHDIEELDAPLFVAHGANDPRVPIEEAEQIKERAGDETTPIETMFIDDAGHVLRSLDHRIEICTRVATFLETHV